MGQKNTFAFLEETGFSLWEKINTDQISSLEALEFKEKRIFSELPVCILDFKETSILQPQPCFAGSWEASLK